MAYFGDAGFDIDAPKGLIIRTKLSGDGELFRFDTFKTVEDIIGRPLKEDECGIIVARSSAANNGIFINDCVIDSGYTGTINVFGMSLIDKPNYNKSLCSLIVVKIGEYHKDGEPRNENKIGSSDK